MSTICPPLGADATDGLDRPEFASKHANLLTAGLRALRSRESFSAFEGRTPPGPSREEAERRLDALLGTSVQLDGHPGTLVRQHDEVSPHTGAGLGISYPRATVDELVSAATTAQLVWSRLSHGARMTLCLEMLEHLFEQNELLAAATMHTAGQGRGMSLSGSGTNALDRGLEAACAAYAALERVPRSATWTRSFGTTVVELDKSYRTVPCGPAVVVACASFPSWNVYPAVFANLVTGNAVIVKPHPSSVLQMALAVQIMRETLGAAGLPPDLVLLSTDSTGAPVTTELVTADGVGIVDFTGSAAFGSWVEEHARQAVVFTETSGVNSMVIESLDDADATIRSIAGTLALFSGQMCVAPQNVYVPAAGITTADGPISFEELGRRIVVALTDITSNPRRAAALMGTVQSPRTIDHIRALSVVAAERGEVLLAPTPWDYPGWPAARTTSPLVATVSLDDRDLYGHEQFGPVVFLIPVADADAGVRQATEDARTRGAIAAYVLSQDDEFIERAEDAFARAGAALSINIVGPMPMGFSAAFSDYHVTGLNPAGTATLTDEAFIAGRFRVVQSRRPTRPAQRTASEKRDA